jgi:uncharacterized repeat protein (TIGR03803 family)
MTPAWINFNFRAAALLAIIAFDTPHVLAQQTNFNINTLYSFSAYNGDGNNSHAPLILNTSGALYGTTSYGGTNGVGTVFTLAPPATAGGIWEENVLYNFTGGNDGSYPYAGLIADASGALYASVTFGGTPACTSGCGAVLGLSPAVGTWTATVLYDFAPCDGIFPSALIPDASGALYGTTQLGGKGLTIGGFTGLPPGPNLCNSGGDGTVFKLTPPCCGRRGVDRSCAVYLCWG